MWNYPESRRRGRGMPAGPSPAGTKEGGSHRSALGRTRASAPSPRGHGPGCVPSSCGAGPRGPPVAGPGPRPFQGCVRPDEVFLDQSLCHPVYPVQAPVPPHLREPHTFGGSLPTFAKEPPLTSSGKNTVRHESQPRGQADPGHLALLPHLCSLGQASSFSALFLVCDTGVALQGVAMFQANVIDVSLTPSQGLGAQEVAVLRTERWLGPKLGHTPGRRPLSWHPILKPRLPDRCHQPTDQTSPSIFSV